MKKPPSLKQFQRSMETIRTKEDAIAWLGTVGGMSQEETKLSGSVQFRKQASGEGYALFSFYARATMFEQTAGEPVTVDIELTHALEHAAGPVRQLSLHALEIAAEKSLKAGFATRVGSDDPKLFLAAALEKLQIEAAKNVETAKKLDDIERHVTELVESHQQAMANLKSQHARQLEELSAATNAAFAKADTAVAVLSNRAKGWKQAAKAIRQRYMHWKVAAITAYNVLENRAITPPAEPIRLAEESEAIDIEIIPESAPKSAKNSVKRPIPDFKPLTAEEKKERQREAGRRRWEGTTPERRKEHMAMMRTKQEKFR